MSDVLAGRGLKGRGREVVGVPLLCRPHAVKGVGVEGLCRGGGVGVPLLCRPHKLWALDLS